ncbi:hypothetical protein J6590_023634 [Homalodisca vitripennis]|nr:hypothetical protein J6590_023634 [Homalodisca vitripennis]
MRFTECTPNRPLRGSARPFNEVKPGNVEPCPRDGSEITQSRYVYVHKAKEGSTPTPNFSPRCAALSRLRIARPRPRTREGRPRADSKHLPVYVVGGRGVLGKTFPKAFRLTIG